MSLNVLSERCRKIINILLYRHEYISLQKIAEETGVSRRSIYYDICNINEWLEEYGIAGLESERGKGLLIPESDRERITDLLQQKQTEDNYIFLPSERVKIIICYMIHSDVPV